MSRRPLYIWLLERTDDFDYSETDSAVVIAGTEQEAREIAETLSGLQSSVVWGASSTQVRAIGTAMDPEVQGVVLSSFYGD